MNKQLSVMGLAARASMVPVLIASGLTALAVGTLTYLANPEHTGGAAGVGAAPLAAAVGYLMVMVMLCLGGCGFGSQTLCPLPLRLTETVVVRQQRLRQHSLPGCGHLLCHKCYGSGTAAPQRRGCLQHTRHIAVFIIAQTRAITNKKQGLFAIFYKISQICNRPGVIVQQAGVGGKVKRCAIYLCAAGIQCAEHRALAGVGSSQRFQRRHRGAQGLAREGQPLDGGQPDAQAGKAARACVDSIQVDVRTGQPAHL